MRRVAGASDGRTPLLLVHGSGGNRLTWWQQIAALAADRVVVAVDARGAGRSTDRADLAGPIQQVPDLDVLRVALGIERWDVVGHSLGGWTALRYKALGGEAVRRCVIVSSVAGVFPPVVEEHWATFAAQSWPAQSLVGVTPSLTPAFASAEPARAHLYQLLAGLNPPPSMTAPAMRIRDADLPLEPVPGVTFVVGAEDVVVPPDVVRAAADAVGADCVEVAGTGHLPFWEKPDEVNALLRRLLG